MSDTIYDGDPDRLTFYGTTGLDARRRALRFQAENLDYVLAAVCFASGQSGLSQERSITVKVCTHRYADSANITSVRCGLVEHAAKLLELPYSEYVQALGAVNDSIAEARLKVIQNERHRSVAAMNGATCRATGRARDSKHGYEGGNAEVWRKAWDYCDSALRHEASKDDDEDDVSRLVPVYEPKVARSTEDDDEHYIPHKVDCIRLNLGRAGALGYVKYTNGVNTTLAPGSAADVLRAAAKVAGWKYACVTRPGEPRQTLLWVEGGFK